MTNDTVVIRLDRASAPRDPNNALIIGDVHLAILRLDESDYRAFSNECTYARCGIYLFQGHRLKCQCHGSEFDADGINVAGPAPTPLRRVALTHDRAARELFIALGMDF